MCTLKEFFWLLICHVSQWQWLFKFSTFGHLGPRWKLPRGFVVILPKEVLFGESSWRRANSKWPLPTSLHQLPFWLEPYPGYNHWDLGLAKEESMLSLLSRAHRLLACGTQGTAHETTKVESRLSISSRAERPRVCGTQGSATDVNTSCSRKMTSLSWGTSNLAFAWVKIEKNRNFEI